MENLNLIWQTQAGDQTSFELEYTTEILFKNFNLKKFFDEGRLDLVMDNSVIIYSNNSGDVPNEFKIYLEKFVKNNFNFYLLHLSNENLNHNCDYYSKANHVFRPYYDSKIELKNVTFIPLGFKSGFLSKENKSNEKKYSSVFIGQVKSDREEIVNIIKNFQGYIHTTNSWNCSTSLSTDLCSNIYNQTKFVPCPMGWVNPDSYRIMETLESNSIPILKTYDNLNYFTKIWGYTPIPTLNNWNDLENILRMEEDEYDLLHNTIHSWYENFKIFLSNKIEKKIILSTKEKNKNVKKSLVHLITPLYRYNNIRILYWSILNLTNDFNWYLIEGNDKIGEESLDFLNEDTRVHRFKMETKYKFGHEQRNFFIENIKCGENDWCYFLDDDNILTEDFINTITEEKNNDVDVILFSQKKGLTEKIRLYGNEGHLKLGKSDIGSFAIKYNIIKNTKINHEDLRNADGHYAEQIASIPNIRVKYYSNKFTRYNSLSFDIT